MSLILHPCQAKFFYLELHPSCLKSRATNPEMSLCFLFFQHLPPLPCFRAFTYPGSPHHFSINSCILSDTQRAFLSSASYRESDIIRYTKCLFCCLKYSILTIPAGFNIQKLKHCWAGTQWDCRAECEKELLRKSSLQWWNPAVRKCSSCKALSDQMLRRWEKRGDTDGSALPTWSDKPTKYTFTGLTVICAR